MIPRLALFGATGDLAARFLLPGLARLLDAGQLPDGLQVVGAAQQRWDDATYEGHAAAALAEHAPDVPVEVRRRLLAALRYRPVDLADAGSVRGVLDAFSPGPEDGAGGGAVAAYLALPPGSFPAAVRALGDAGLPAGSRIAAEKPFGQDAATAAELNALLAEVTGAAGEPAVFRVDHVLGMPAVPDLLALRRDSGLGQVWNSAYVEQVDVLWEETLALEGRADFYDRTGAVQDVVQNHVLQLLALVAMDLPATPGERELHDRKVEVLRAVRLLTRSDVAERTRRARYTAGRLAGPGDRTVPDYAREEGVDPARATETFAELVLELDRPRWAGTRFVLRAGKALAARRRGVLVHFRPAAHLPAPMPAGVPPDQLWIDLDEPAGTALALAGPSQPGPRVSTSAPPVGEAAAYGRVLLDLLSGGSALSVRGDEAEQAWRIVEPVVEAWAAGAAPLLEYPAGSAGPLPTGPAAVAPTG